jgi:hypothetical protein
VAAPEEREEGASRRRWRGPRAAPRATVADLRAAAAALEGRERERGLGARATQR